MVSVDVKQHFNHPAKLNQLRPTNPSSGPHQPPTPCLEPFSFLFFFIFFLGGVGGGAGGGAEEGVADIHHVIGSRISVQRRAFNVWKTVNGERQTDRQRQTERDRDRNRDRGRQTETQRETERGRETEIGREGEPGGGREGMKERGRRRGDGETEREGAHNLDKGGGGEE